MNSLLILCEGFGVSCGLIMAIGAQNAFVIRQGLKRQHMLLTALVCSFIDALLISFGVIGMGHYMVEYEWLIQVSKYFAAIFLIVYGALSMRSAFKSGSLQSVDEEALVSAKRTLFSLLALSLLNPHVYLDTVILLGSIASQHPAHARVYFAVGAMAASFLWFFSITFGAQLLAPFLRKRSCWRVIDASVAIIMWMIAITLLKL